MNICEICGKKFKPKSRYQKYCDECHKNKNFYKLIIIEGIDKSGKTTFSEKLLKTIKNSVLIKGNMKPFDSSLSEKEKVKNYYKVIMEIINLEFLKNKTVILDRYYPSQVIYSIKRGHDDFKDSWFTKFEKEILKKLEKRILYIYCRVNKDIIEKRFITNKEEFLNIKEIKEINKRYESFFTKTKVPFFVNNTENNSDTNIILNKLKN